MNELLNLPGSIWSAQHGSSRSRRAWRKRRLERGRGWQRPRRWPRPAAPPRRRPPLKPSGLTQWQIRFSCLEIKQPNEVTGSMPATAKSPSIDTEWQLLGNASIGYRKTSVSPWLVPSSTIWPKYGGAWGTRCWNEENEIGYFLKNLHFRKTCLTIPKNSIF